MYGDARGAADAGARVDRAVEDRRRRGAADARERRARAEASGREYVQLHRDTTVASLTAALDLSDGALTARDTPLALAEDGELALADGRTLSRARAAAAGGDVDGSSTDDDDDDVARPRPVLSPSERAAQVVFVHDDFRLIVLANRPGFPFLGNDFYRECGDVFACHAVERELVKVAKHLDAYPGDGLAAACADVFAFDGFDARLAALLATVLEGHGVDADEALGGGQSYGDMTLKLPEGFKTIKRPGAPRACPATGRSTAPGTTRPTWAATCSPAAAAAAARRASAAAAGPTASTSASSSAT
ncbi:ATPase [Aureococcus anophagefferens]|nr:ATPase [Aureococcus anophagefferens]